MELEIQRKVEKMVHRVDPKFKNKLLESPGGETFKFCYQCGTCTATCPVARFTDIFRPNKIIHLAKLGVRNVVFSDAVWLCVNCYSCTERCPQGVRVADVMRALKNLAVEDGYMPDFSKAFLTTILQTGWVYTIPASRLSKRESDGLPPLATPTVADLTKLAETTDVTKLLDQERAQE